jgi:hypothetical protein
MNPRRRFYPIVLAMAVFAGGCERFGIEDPAKAAAAREAEGKAVGAGCRHSGRSLEDCYSLNDGAPKAAVFAGWKEMNDYMVANKMEVVPAKGVHAAAPEVAPTPSGNSVKAAEAASAADKPAKH